MNHPRRARLRRLLLLVPLALLGAALLVRSRLPRPQTEGDKWLWEQAEVTSSLGIVFGDAGKDILQQEGLTTAQHSYALSDNQVFWVEIEDRQGIRSVLRALQGTPTFTTGRTPPKSYAAYDRQTLVGLTLRGQEKQTLCLTQEPSGSFVYREDDRLFAPVNPHALASLRKALKEALEKAKRKAQGYQIPG